MLGASSVAQAQDDVPSQKQAADPIKTTHPDAFYGSKQSSLHQAALPGTDLDLPPVDRRDEVDPIGIQGALFPTAHIPQTYRVIYRNQMLFGHQVDVRVMDRLMLGGTWVISPGSLQSNAGGDIDRRFALNARFLAYQNGDLSIALQAGGQQQKGLYRRDTRVLSGHLSTQIDYKVSDRVVLGGGVIGNMPIQLTYTDLDISQCETRGDLVDGFCTEYKDFSQSMPSGGRFLMGWFGLSYYNESNVFLKAEAFTSVRRGTIWGLEGSLYNADRLEAQLDRYNTTATSFGLLDGAPLGLSFSTGYTYKRVAAQLTLMALPGALPDFEGRADDFFFFTAPPHIFPMMTIGVGI